MKIFAFGAFLLGRLSALDPACFAIVGNQVAYHKILKMQIPISSLKRDDDTIKYEHEMSWWDPR